MYKIGVGLEIYLLLHYNIHMVIKEVNGRKKLCSVNAEDYKLFLSDPDEFYKKLNGVEIIGSYAFGVGFEGEIILPKSIKEVNEAAFAGSNIKGVVFEGDLETLGESAFDGCTKLKRVAFCGNAETLDCNAFKNCTNLTNVILPKGLKQIKSACFKQCYNLESITIPETVTNIPNDCFRGCTGLKQVNFGENAMRIGNNAFAGCINLSKIDGLKGVQTIGDGAFMQCKSLTKAYLPDRISFNNVYSGCSAIREAVIGSEEVGKSAFSYCVKLTDVKFLTDVKRINSSAFDNCISINNLVIPKDIESVGASAFVGCSFKYLYKDNNGENILAVNLPTNTQDVIHLGAFWDFDYGICNKKYSERFKQVAKLSFMLDKFKLKMPYGILKPDLADFTLNDFISQVVKANYGEIMKMAPARMDSFMRIAAAFGCFDGVPLLDKDGRPTSTNVSLKACSFLVNVMRNYDLFEPLIIGEYFSAAIPEYVNQHLLNYLSVVDSKKYLPNLGSLLAQEEEYPDIVNFVFNNFEKIRYVKTHNIGRRGVPKNLSWEAASVVAFTNTLYGEIEHGYERLAEICGKINASEKTYKTAVDAFNEAKKQHIKTSLVSVPLKEAPTCGEDQTQLDKAEQTLDEIKQLLKFGKKLVLDNGGGFTYELLSKDAPENPVIGAFSNDCCVIGGMFYGAKICDAVITSNELQNLVIRDSENNIAAKGVLYVDKENGYAVFNGFSVALQYKTDEFEDRAGFYDDESNRLVAARNQIFSAFIRGTYAFVRQYNKENPEAPITKVTVGDSNGNKLRRQLQKFNKLRKPLTVPLWYSFYGAKDNQYLIYDGEENGNK